MTHVQCRVTDLLGGAFTFQLFTLVEVNAFFIKDLCSLNNIPQSNYYYIIVKGSLISGPQTHKIKWKNNQFMWNYYSKLILYFFILAALKSRITPLPKSLAAGTKQTRPVHIPAHLPPLPDPHSYIKTPVSCFFKPGDIVQYN